MSTGRRVAVTDWTPDPDAWRDWFPDQTCPGCGQEHPGADACEAPSLFDMESD